MVDGSQVVEFAIDEESLGEFQWVRKLGFNDVPGVRTISGEFHIAIVWPDQVLISLRVHAPQICRHCMWDSRAFHALRFRLELDTPDAPHGPYNFISTANGNVLIALQEFGPMWAQRPKLRLRPREISDQTWFRELREAFGPYAVDLFSSASE